VTVSNYICALPSSGTYRIADTQNFSKIYCCISCISSCNQMPYGLDT